VTIYLANHPTGANNQFKPNQTVTKYKKTHTDKSTSIDTKAWPRILKTS